MEPDLIAICDRHLPGRDPTENRALEKFMRAIKSEGRKLNAILDAPRSTARGMTSKLERGLEQRHEVNAAYDDLIAECQRLAGERAKLLPIDAEEVMNAGRAPDDYSTDRYKVVCTGPSGRLYLGGCLSHGDADRRADWFRQRIDARRLRAKCDRRQSFERQNEAAQGSLEDIGPCDWRDTTDDDILESIGLGEAICPAHQDHDAIRERGEGN